MEILSVASQKQIKVYAVKGAWQLDNSIQSRILAMAFSMAAEIERDLISQRTREALAARKKAGASSTPSGPKLRLCSPTAPPRSSLPIAMEPPRPIFPAG
jgi:DNA invertase Pin-like site-specific DNA recombinase